MKETPKEIENNNNINNDNNNILDLNNFHKNSNDSLKLSIKSDKINNNNIKDDEREEYKLYTKSNTFNNSRQANNSFNYSNINDNINNNIIQIQKSRTCRENEVLKRQSFTIRLNNMGANHLETVLETVSEVSNSKNVSSEISDDDDNVNKENENNDQNKGGTNEKEKNKEESGNININIDLKIQGSDTKINDSDYNAATKKTLFLSSEKTH